MVDFAVTLAGLTIVLRVMDMQEHHARLDNYTKPGKIQSM